MKVRQIRAFLLLALVILAIASAESVAQTSWSKVTVAYNQLYNDVLSAYADTNIPPQKKANRLRDFYNKVDDLLGLVDESCTDYAVDIPKGKIEIDEPKHRNLLKVAYKNAVGPRRSSFETLDQIIKKELITEFRGFKYDIAEKCIEKVKTELRDISFEAVGLTKKFLEPSSKTFTEETKVFMYMEQGDFYRYLAETPAIEISRSHEQQRMSLSSQEAYKVGFDKAKSELACAHPLRLNIALNYTNFLFERMANPREAFR
ncbi:Oidioi.mRNA.OKI2018_I69.chr1.g1531.t1.cds [Oikopleura dioica]|uniref:Oidioi.mRNA.OKI2018_I69.chr1.g1531.t1.cds n=1 Tax=Oikopleura dioica TaxID=34765 RepID=A0ABN7STH0_OIKDI|nr:Oidioi.mRNA.OKI2018_I69.chr1.g1531.t1.cds [Oikopleura dioica]